MAKIVVSQDGTVLDFDGCIILECPDDIADDLCENYGDSERFDVAVMVDQMLKETK